MTLLVTLTSYHLLGSFGLRCTSVPFTNCSRRPPPLPLSAVLPANRLALILVPGPTPSDSCGGQSMSTAEFSHAVPSGSEPCTISPPPHVVSVGLVLWLKRNQLCSMSPLYMKP